MPNFRRRQHRLKDFDYGPGYAYFVTILTNNKTKYFNDHLITRIIESEFEFRAKQNGINLYCYCIMPDNVHFLISFNDDYEKTLSNWVSSFKRFTQKKAKEKSGVIKLWHTNYYDHIVRKSESFETIVEYIIMNPVRKEIVKEWEDYPYSKVLYDSL